MTAELRRFLLLENKGDGGWRCWRTAVFRIGFGRDSERFGVKRKEQITALKSFKKKKKKGRCVRSFADRLWLVVALSYCVQGILKDGRLSRPSG